MSSRSTLMFTLILLHGAVDAGADCPPFNNTITGGDYTNPEHREKLAVVERFHFTPQVERLEKGQSGYLGDDISYTLDHFANHHRALTSLARLALREKTSRPRGAKYSSRAPASMRRSPVKASRASGQGRLWPSSSMRRSFSPARLFP